MAADDERDAVHGELERLDGPAVRVDYSFTTLDDRRVDLRATILRGGDGEPAAGRLAVLRDRTEELRYGEILRRTQTLETVGTLAAGVAHEVNNPLAFVRANLTELARMGERVQALSGQPGAKLAADLSDLHDVAVEALEGIQRIERVVSDMRRLSAAQTDGAATVDMHEVVRDAVRLARLRRGPDVPLSVSLSNERPVVYGSSQLLVQCVLNLLVNALEAVEPLPQPEIRVESIVTPDAVSVCVSDNGPGVSEAMRERIFSPFVTSREGSRGLGLTIARDVASDHGGSLRCEQPQGPMGACFVLRVPVESACI
jgi:signal transduction histidine kinase